MAALTRFARLAGTARPSRQHRGPGYEAYVRKNGAVREHLQALNDQLRPYYLDFAYRVFDEVVTFLIPDRPRPLVVVSVS